MPSASPSARDGVMMTAPAARAVAEAFLADKEQRAVAHPPPSLKRCYIITDRGRLLFDVTTDQGLAKDVPPEAHRRFRADLRAKEEHNRQDRAEQLALHEEKKRFIADWVAVNGTDEQKVRQAAGVLPMAEAIEGITDQSFAVNGRLPLYTRDGAERLQRFLRESSGMDDTVVDSVGRCSPQRERRKGDGRAVGGCPGPARLVPDANVVLREHVLSSKRHQDSASLTVFGVLVTKRHGPFVLRREYVVDDSQQAAVGS